jgi:hypothetical protein
MDQIQPLIDQGKWAALALVIVVLLARAKSPAIGSPFARVPVEHRPRVVAALGILTGILEAVVRGVPWPKAIAGGVITGALAMWIHGVAGGISPRPAPGVVASGSATLGAPVVDTVIAGLPEPSGGGAAPSTTIEASASWGPKPSGDGS